MVIAMKYKYGNFTQKQIHNYKKNLHKKIHWLLLYEESGYSDLVDYITNLQIHIAGLAEIIDSPHVVNLAAAIEAILLEYQKEQCEHKIYRKLVFDAHSIVDLLPEMDGDLSE